MKIIDYHTQPLPSHLPLSRSLLEALTATLIFIVPALLFFFFTL